MSDTNSITGRKREAAQRTANGIFQAWENRTALVKQQAASESAASDAKTARLKALRLAKEEEDRAAAAAAPPPAATARKTRKRAV